MLLHPRHQHCSYVQDEDQTKLGILAIAMAPDDPIVLDGIYRYVSNEILAELSHLIAYLAARKIFESSLKAVILLKQLHLSSYIIKPIINIFLEMD